ncbi:degenerin-like protein asic-2 [Argopecten irradians]|uniref:degenerin-like protein asic-2 n=1 Tax=Argopecten irradians TaxID=31199 RepID=UPI0037151E4C
MFQPVKSFMEYTSIHGLGRIATVKHIIHKLVWTALFMTSIGMCIYQVTRLGQQFTSNPISTTISLKSAPQAFPAVIICNINPASFSKIVGIKEFNHILSEASDHSMIPLEKFKNASGMTASLPTFNHTPSFNLNQYSHPLGMAKKLFEARLANLSTANLTALNGAFEDFIVDCKYDGRNCSAKDFKVVRDGGHGICYKKNEDDFLTENAGKDAGLEMIISVSQAEYIPYVAESAGIRIIIQDDATEVFTGNGFSLPTGFETDISVSVTETNRVAGPENRCEKDSLWQRRLACMRNCSIAHASRKCNCAPHHEYSYDIQNTCVTVAELNCLKTETEAMMRSEICNECKFPCFEKTYKTFVSMTRWPSNYYREVLATDYNWGSQVDKIRADYMRVRVFFSSLTKEIIDEELSYTSENFVSDIGGQLGLWAGLSVLSVAEVLELIVLWITYCCKRKSRTNHSDIPEKLDE